MRRLILAVRRVGFATLAAAAAIGALGTGTARADDEAVFPA